MMSKGEKYTVGFYLDDNSSCLLYVDVDMFVVYGCFIRILWIVHIYVYELIYVYDV